MKPDLSALADAYLQHYRSSDKHQDFWAWEAVRELVNDFDSGWSLILLLFEKAESEAELSYIAAGPLEDYIDLHGFRALDNVEKVAEENPRLLRAVSGVGVLYYYDEFDRWYELLHKYGHRKESVADPSVIADVMAVMRDFLDQTIDSCTYDQRIHELLDKPFADKAAQRLLQQRSWDLERTVSDGCKSANYMSDRLSETELKKRIAETLIELESLGYRANG